MANLVLYRKYRPQNFSEIIGQEHVVKTITNALSSNAISHAYIFSGPRGSGKTTIARLLAKAANCHNRKKGEFEPCDTCSSCKEIRGGRSLDLIEIDAASHRGIDEIRELREGIRFSPNKEEYKVFVIDECFTGDHLVSTIDGRVKMISEIKNGEKIASIDLNNGAVVAGEVKNWFRRKTKNLIGIKTPQAYLKCTPSHRLWVLSDSKFKLIEAKNLKVGDFLLSPVFLPHTRKNNLSPEQLSFLALIQCDGHISKDSSVVQLEASKDKGYFKEVINKGVIAWGIKERPIFKITSRGSMLARIYSKDLKDKLINLGCPSGKKGHKIDIPDSVFQAPINSVRSYIDTCFCCEGNIDYNSKKSSNFYRLHFNSTSEVFAKKLQLLLKKFGIASSFLKILKDRKNVNHSVQYRVTLSHYNLNIFNEKIGLSLERKKVALGKCYIEKEKQDTIPIEKIVLEKQKELELSYSLCFSHNVYPDSRQHLSRKSVINFLNLTKAYELNKFLQFSYEKIKKIEKLNETSEVYDFTVEGTHTFIANGICSSNCHQLTKEAVNALLKTLEEPPAHAIFVLATTEIHKMIPTIISRCQRFDFRKLTLPEIVKRLEIIAKKEKAKIEKPALELIALNSSGAVRDAESLLDQVLTFGGAFKKEIKVEDIKELLGLADTAQIAEFVDFLSQKKGAEAVSFLEKTFESGFDPQEFAKALVSYLRQAMLLKMNPAAQNPMILGLTKEEQEKMKAQIESLSQREIQRAVNLFMEAESKMKYSSIPELPLEVALVDFIQES